MLWFLLNLGQLHISNLTLPDHFLLYTRTKKGSGEQPIPFCSVTHRIQGCYLLVQT